MSYVKPTADRLHALRASTAVLLGIAMTPIAVAQNADSPNRAANQAVPEWAAFRDGGASIAEGAALPLAWDEPAWTAELPAFGHSSPVVRNGVAYVTSVAADGEDAKDTLWLTAIRVTNGEELWRQSWPASERLPYDQYTARAAPLRSTRTGSPSSSAPATCSRRTTTATGSGAGTSPTTTAASPAITASAARCC